MLDDAKKNGWLGRERAAWFNINETKREEGDPESTSNGDKREKKRQNKTIICAEAPCEARRGESGPLFSLDWAVPLSGLSPSVRLTRGRGGFRTDSLGAEGSELRTHEYPRRRKRLVQSTEYNTRRHRTWRLLFLHAAWLE